MSTTGSGESNPLFYGPLSKGCPDPNLTGLRFARFLQEDIIPLKTGLLFQADRGTRTPDQMLTKHQLYQLSYAGKRHGVPTPNTRTEKESNFNILTVVIVSSFGASADCLSGPNPSEELIFKNNVSEPSARDVERNRKREFPGFDTFSDHLFTHL